MLAQYYWDEHLEDELLAITTGTGASSASASTDAGGAQAAGGAPLMPEQRERERERLRHLTRHRELFLTRQPETLPATYIRGKCALQMLADFESPLEYIRREVRLRLRAAPHGTRLYVHSSTVDKTLSSPFALALALTRLWLDCLSTSFSSLSRPSPPVYSALNGAERDARCNTPKAKSGGRRRRRVSPRRASPPVAGCSCSCSWTRIARSLRPEAHREEAAAPAASPQLDVAYIGRREVDVRLGSASFRFQCCQTRVLYSYNVTHVHS